MADNTSLDDRTRTEQLIRELRRTPMFNSLIPMDARAGWPAPLAATTGDTIRLAIQVPFYSVRRGTNPGQGCDLYPPFASIAVDWKTARPVRYDDLRFRGMWHDDAYRTPIGTFPHPEVELLGATYPRKVADLFDFYDQLFEATASQRRLDDAVANEFASLLQLLIEPAMSAYYREIAPKFYSRYLEG